jgi:hypothetical protein
MQKLGWFQAILHSRFINASKILPTKHSTDFHMAQKE